MAKESIKYFLQIGMSVVIDETNCSIISRANIIDCIQEAINPSHITAVVMPQLDKIESLKRKNQLETNYGYTVEQWEKVWERKNSKYSKPQEYEGFDIIEYIGE
jgi:hypothetical protein